MYSDNGRTLHPRMVIYSQDGLGLGHMRRTSSIASQLLRIRPDTCVLTLSDSRLGQFFNPVPNHDYLKLPSIIKVGPGDWQGVNLALPFARIQAMRQEVIRSAVLNFKPHIFLVDHMPHGAMGELLPTLEALKETGAETKVVLGLRDILDAPEVVQHRWQVEGAYEAIKHYYDTVLVYGMREVFDLAEQYQFPAQVTERLRYCGYVCTPIIARHAAKTRTKYLLGAKPNAKLIVAMAGGGADAYPMMRAIIDALPAIQARQPCVLVLVTGPFMPSPLRADLQTRARGLPARVLTLVDDMPSFMEAADLVIAMAGYNTTMEILHSGKPAILIPRIGPSAEQGMRARLFAARNWVEMIDLNNLMTDQLAHMVINNLAREFHPVLQNKPDLQGLAFTGEQLLSLLPLGSSEAEAVVPVPSDIPNQSNRGISNLTWAALGGLANLTILGLNLSIRPEFTYTISEIFSTGFISMLA